MTSPVSGDCWYKGGTQSITWSTEGLTNANVIIQLRRGSSVIRTVANPTPNDGSYSWKIPGGITPRSDYFIRIKTANGQATGDSALFTIKAPYLTVDSPAPGDSWYRGETRPITWSGTGTTASKVTIQLMRGPTVIRMIASGAPNSGNYGWKIPSDVAPQPDYCLKIRTTDGLASGASSLFTIKTPKIEILAPSEGTVWPRGASQVVSWLASGPQNAHLNIVLRRNAVKVRDIALGTDNDGSFGWVVPLDLVAGTGYDVKITTADGAIKSISAKFSVE